MGLDAIAKAPGRLGANAKQSSEPSGGGLEGG